jgi:hypothetical protein
MSVYDRKGGRRVELLIPFEHLGKTVDAINLRPILFDHTLRWQQGEFRTSVALLAHLAGEPESVIKMLRYPDADRVFAVMMDMLPALIRLDIDAGQVPIATGPPRPQAAPEPEPGAERIEDMGDIAAE